jgi:hypothetical protein
MIQNQKADGCVGLNRSHGHGGGYNHAIAGLALAEAYGMGKVHATGIAAQKAVDYSTETHQQEYNGWRYSPKSAGDLSVSGWFIMQLKSAKVAGLKIPGGAWQGASTFLDSVEQKNVEVDGYGGGLFYYTPSKSHWTSDISKARISSVGMLGRLFMGHPADEIMGGLNLMAENTPDWQKGDFYYWYYGTLVMFQAGGDFWKQWNIDMKATLLANQRKGGAEDGSWNPELAYGKRAGRVFSTAMGALCLEVYYRYMPLLR